MLISSTFCGCNIGEFDQEDNVRMYFFYIYIAFFGNNWDFVLNYGSVKNSNSIVVFDFVLDLIG